MTHFNPRIGVSLYCTFQIFHKTLVLVVIIHFLDIRPGCLADLNLNLEQENADMYKAMVQKDQD